MADELFAAERSRTATGELDVVGLSASLGFGCKEATWEV
jgi:hypothetical protein